MEVKEYTVKDCSNEHEGAVNNKSTDPMNSAYNTIEGAQNLLSVEPRQNDLMVKSLRYLLQTNAFGQRFPVSTRYQGGKNQKLIN